MAGVGFNADSYYETLLKAGLLFGDQRYLQMWAALYNDTDAALRRGDFLYDMPVGGEPRQLSRFALPTLASSADGISLESLWNLFEISRVRTRRAHAGRSKCPMPTASRLWQPSGPA